MRTLYGLTLGIVLGSVLATLYGQEAPSLTEIDRLRVQTVVLMQQLASMTKEADDCRGQLASPRATQNQQSIDQASRDAKAAIEKAHEGWLWNPQTGEWTRKTPPAVVPAGPPRP